MACFSAVADTQLTGVELILLTVGEEAYHGGDGMAAGV